MAYLIQGAFQPGTVQNFTTSGSSQAGNAVGNTTAIVRVAVNQDTYVATGSTPTATTGSMMITAGGVEYLAVTPGITKVAVLQVSAAGRASVTELAVIDNS
jgi:hypothetical protein